MSKHILAITANIKDDMPYNKVLSKAIFKKLQIKYPEGHLYAHELTSSMFSNLESRSAGSTVEDKIAIKYSAKAFAELLQADIIVMSLSLKNFDIPDILESWIDYVIRAYEIFHYTDGFPVDPVTNKKVYLVITSTGADKKKLADNSDFTYFYIKTVLNFIGITNMVTFHVEGDCNSKSAEKALVEVLNTVNDTIF